MEQDHTDNETSSSSSSSSSTPSPPSTPRAIYIRFAVSNLPAAVAESTSYEELLQSLLLSVIASNGQSTDDNYVHIVPLLFGAGNQQGQPATATKMMDALPVVDPATLTDSLQQAECAVCQEPWLPLLSVGEEETAAAAAAAVVREMPCGHCFHQDCLFVWLKRANTCPCCRWELDTDNTDYNHVIHRRQVERMTHNAQLKCALAMARGCHHSVEPPPSSTPPATTAQSDMVVLPECGCGFHRDCLTFYLGNSGYETNSSIELRKLGCPACGQQQQVNTHELLLPA
jgi:hypothetical protein